MHRFYLPSPDITSKVLEIKEHRILHQLNKVLRMKPGHKFALFDDQQNEWVVEILEINKRSLTANVLEAIKRNTEPKLEVHLYQALPKKTALFELVIQKATEIGVSHIYPLITKRTEKNRLSKFERMQLIAIEAAEQSRRLKIPIIHHPVNFDEAISAKSPSYIAFEYEEKTTLVHHLPKLKKQNEAHLFIGPEGGFEQQEIDLALKHKAQPFSLGPRILRTETAAIASLSLILLGDKN